MKRVFGYILAAVSLVSLSSPAVAQAGQIGRNDAGNNTRLRTTYNGNLKASMEPLAANESGVAFSTYRLTSAATTNGALIATGAHRIYGGYIYNASAATKYVKFYNRATAPVVGTTTPVLTVAIAAGQTFSLSQLSGYYGFFVPLGLGVAITGAYADNDATAVAAGDVIMHVNYL